MVLITIVTGAYKPTYNWGASHCGDQMKLKMSHLMEALSLHDGGRYKPVKICCSKNKLKTEAPNDTIPIYIYIKKGQHSPNSWSF